MTDEQTNKNNSTFFAAAAAGEVHALQTWHGDRGPQAHSCTSKTSGTSMYSFAMRGVLGGAENLGEI